MNYSQKRTLHEKTGNNAFAWEERMRKYDKSPTLTIPCLIEGDISDVCIGDDVVFEEIEDGTLKSCTGLRNFVRLKPGKSVHIGVRGGDTVGTMMKNSTTNSEASTEGVWLPPETFDTFGYKSMINNEITIFDNHNHALYFWIDAMRSGIIDKGCELIHIDEHSDLWANENSLNLGRAVENESYAWKFTNLSCNVGNYIQPAINSGLIGSMIRIENEYQIDNYINYTPSKNSILNLDLDIFAPELDYISDSKKMECIRNLIKQVSYVTIATSPFFIDQGKAIEKLRRIFTI